MKKSVLLYFAALFCCFGISVTGCVKQGPDTPPDKPEPEDPKTHTLIIYMMGNNGLEKFMDKNLGKIMGIADRVPEHGRIALFYDRGNYTRLTELVVEDGQVKQELIEEYMPDATSSVDPDFMSGVFAAVREHMPSETYGLVMSSHGGGWVPSDIFDMYMMSENSGYESSVKPNFFGQDDYDCMEIPDLARVLSEMKFDYILFDACFMSSVEALYDLRDVTDYIIASSAEVLGDGFPYGDIIPMLFRNDHGLKDACISFMDLYEGRSGTISLIDCSKLDMLAQRMKDILVSTGSGKVNTEGIQAYEGFPVHLYFDLEQYAEALVSDGKLLDGFRSALKEAVVFTDHTPTFFTAYGEDGTHELPRSSGLTCHIEQDEYPETHQAFLETGWAKAIGAE